MRILYLISAYTAISMYGCKGDQSKKGDSESLVANPQTFKVSANLKQTGLHLADQTVDIPVGSLVVKGCTKTPLPTFNSDPFTSPSMNINASEVQVQGEIDGCTVAIQKFSFQSEEYSLKSDGVYSNSANTSTFNLLPAKFTLSDYEGKIIQKINLDFSIKQTGTGEGDVKTGVFWDVVVSTKGNLTPLVDFSKNKITSSFSKGVSDSTLTLQLPLACKGADFSIPSCKGIDWFVLGDIPTNGLDLKEFLTDFSEILSSAPASITKKEDYDQSIDLGNNFLNVTMSANANGVVTGGTNGFKYDGNQWIVNDKSLILNHRAEQIFYLLLVNPGQDLANYSDYAYTVYKITVNKDSEVAPSCDDGVLNQDETVIDCGGVCGSCSAEVDNSLIPPGDFSGGGSYSLVYPKDWSPGYQTVRASDNEKLFIQDFSYAGYKNGEEVIPSPAITKTFSGVNDGSADVSAALQKAINDLGDAGGVLFIPEGLYKLKSGIVIDKPNVIIRGAGPGKTKLFFQGLTDIGIHVYAGYPKYIDEYSDDPLYAKSSGWELAADAKIFDNYVRVSNPDGLSVGDDIFISWKITSGFKAEHNSSDFWYHNGKTPYLANFFKRNITKIEGDKIYFKVPLRYNINDARDSAKVRKLVDWRALLSGIGLESFSIATASGNLTTTWNGPNQVSAIQLYGCQDCWIKNINSFASYVNHDYHLRSHGIEIVDSKRVTVDNCVMQKSEHLGSGGNGYLFQIITSNEVLVKNSSGIKGRHNFSINWDFGSSGNVFFNIKSSGGRICDTLSKLQNNDCDRGTIDLHHALHLANLFDNVEMDDSLEILNRQTWSQGAGMTGTQNVMWNIQGTGTVFSYNFDMGYVIGTDATTIVNTSPNAEEWGFPGWNINHKASNNNDFYFSENTAPDDFVEFLGEVEKLSPSSLYVDQLVKRLSK